MASQYFAILTDYGTRAIAHALSQGQPLQLTQFAVGDGNGQAVTPTVSATALVHQTHIAPVSAVSLDPRNNKQVIVELTIPENVGGFYIREMGVFDSQNKLIAYANCPESFKPTESSGSGKVQVLRMILKVESSSAVTLSIDHSVIFITRQQMAPKTITATTQNGFDESGHSHEIAKASTTQQGIVQLTNDTGLESESLALTAKAGKKLAQQTAQLQLNVSQNYIPNSKKSSAVNSNSADTVATSAAVKTAYDKGVEAKTAADNAQSTADNALRTANGKQSPATTLAGYGIGNFKIEPFVGNVNTLQTDGIYAVTQASRSQNLPVSTSCHIQVIAGGDGAWCRQLAYVAYSTDVYERHQTSYQADSWSAWVKIDSLDKIPNSKKSSAVNSESEDNVATSKAAKTAYDKAVEAKTAADNAQSSANNANNNANGRVSKLGDTMTGSLAITGSQSGGFANGLMLKNKAGGPNTSVFVDFYQTDNIPRASMWMRDAGNNSTQIEFLNTPEGADWYRDSRQNVFTITSSGNLWSRAYGWLHDFFAKQNDINNVWKELNNNVMKRGDFISNWYPNHYNGTTVYKIRHLNLMITVMHATGGKELILPEHYDGHFGVWATDRGTGSISVNSNYPVGNNRVRVGGRDDTAVAVLVVGYKNV